LVKPSKVTKTLKTLERFDENHGKHESQRRRGWNSPLAASGGENTLLSPTFGPFIGGWPDHLRQPNVKPQPCHVRRPKVTFGGRTLHFSLVAFLSKLNAFNTSQHENK